MSNTTNLNPYGYNVGLRNVGSYQVSGHPYITGSTSLGAVGTTTKISFPFVTKTITVISSGTFGGQATENSFKISFNDPGDGDVVTPEGSHFITLDSEEDSMTFDAKCKEIYLTAVTAGPSYQLYASLTSIPIGSMYDLTGSGLTSSDTEWP
tara:strand:+ start:158 stop:613 length:456 start_codon:yes stop_codon:yes gene_type:complete